MHRSTFKVRLFAVLAAIVFGPIGLAASKPSVSVPDLGTICKSFVDPASCSKYAGSAVDSSGKNVSLYDNISCQYVDSNGNNIHYSDTDKAFHLGEAKANPAIALQTEQVICNWGAGVANSNTEILSVNCPVQIAFEAKSDLAAKDCFLYSINPATGATSAGASPASTTPANVGTTQ
jgi:hypothetical protein